MLEFLKRKQPPQRIVYRRSSNLTVAKWRTVPELVKKAERILTDEATHLMLDACRNNLLKQIVPDGSPDVYNRAVGQALAQGYAAALSDLESLAVYQRPEQELKETFEAETPEE